MNSTERKTAGVPEGFAPGLAALAAGFVVTGAAIALKLGLLSLFQKKLR